MNNASKSIDQYIAGLADWRGKRIARLHKLSLESAPGMAEEWKWDTPVWSHNGSVFAVGAFKDYVKINFFKGALLKDTNGLFNAGLDAKKSAPLIFSNMMRSIQMR